MFYLNGVIWLAIAVITLVRQEDFPWILLGESFRWLLFSLLALNAALMVAAGFVLGTRRRIAWLFALAVLTVNIVFTFTDEVGLADWATAAFDLVIVGLLIGTRGWFAARRQG
jgi:hypothetical protein